MRSSNASTEPAAPIALTCGEPAGIGPEIAAKAWRELGARLPFFYLGDPGHLPPGTPVATIHDPSETGFAAARGLPVLAHPFPAPARPAAPDPANAAAVVAVIARGVELVRAGRAGALCTGPIHKKALKDGADFAYPGHTEYLAALAGVDRVVMMLACDELRVVPTTIHLPLARGARRRSTRTLLSDTLRITHAALIRDFGVEAPRIAVAGPQPPCRRGRRHGPRGDRDVIVPVLEALRAEGMALAGPLSADTMFHAARPRPLRRGGRDVPRPGADPDQDDRLRGRGQRHAGAAVHPHLARPRHRLQHRGPGPGRPDLACRRAAGSPTGWRARGPPRGRRSPRPAAPDGEPRGPGIRQRPDRPRAPCMSAIDELPPLRAVIAAHGLSARKALGQNFLLDLNLTAKIARQAGDLTASDVLEVGPGPGGLTRGLLAEGARRVLAVEKDARCLPALAEIAEAYPGRLTVLHGDALAVDPTAHLAPPIRVVANLPYNVGTELLTRWLDPPDWPPFWESLTLMFQREVAERIVARPGSKAYGRLAILCQWRAEPRIVMDLPPEAFTPPPKVRSSVVHITAAGPRRDFRPTGRRCFRTVAAAFNQRRKMLRASLRGLAPDIEERLRAAGIAPTDRAEEIPLEGFCALARELAPA